MEEWQLLKQEAVAGTTKEASSVTTLAVAMVAIIFDVGRQKTDNISLSAQMGGAITEVGKQMMAGRKGIMRPKKKKKKKRRV